MKMKILAAAIAAFGALTAQSAMSATANTSVNGSDNIYYTNWGSSNNGLSLDVVGKGNDVTAVSNGSGAIDFSMLGPVMSIATGSVVDAGLTATDADGGSGIFNGLAVYSMIGVWSSTSAAITAIGDSFVVGTSGTFVVPNFANAFLFLGENDGVFSDNSGAYSVSITYTTPVPLPAGMPLILAGLGAFGFIARRKRKSA